MFYGFVCLVFSFMIVYSLDHEKLMPLLRGLSWWCWLRSCSKGMIGCHDCRLVSYRRTWLDRNQLGEGWSNKKIEIWIWFFVLNVLPGCAIWFMRVRGKVHWRFFFRFWVILLDIFYTFIFWRVNIWNGLYYDLFIFRRRL